MDGGAWWATVHGFVKSWTRLSDFTFHFHALEKEMATHSSVLAWRIPGMGEPGGLPSMGLHRVRHDWVTFLSLFTFMHWRRKWQPTPAFLPGESQGREPGGLPSMGSHRIGHDWCDLAAAAAGQFPYWFGRGEEKPTKICRLRTNGPIIQLGKLSQRAQHRAPTQHNKE